MPVEGAISPYTSTGLGAKAGRSGIAPRSTVITSEDAFITHRGDHLGLTLAMRRVLLATALPQGTTLYAGFFTSMPDRRGIGGTEVSVGGYARIAVSSWTTENVGATARRMNATSLVWADFTSGTTLLGWGLWSAVTDGELRCFDFLRTNDGDPVTYPIEAGGNPGIPAGRLGLAL